MPALQRFGQPTNDVLWKYILIKVVPARSFNWCLQPLNSAVARKKKSRVGA